MCIKSIATFSRDGKGTTKEWECDVKKCNFFRCFALSSLFLPGHCDAYKKGGLATRCARPPLWVDIL